MKKIHVVGGIIILITIVIGVATALKTGEKSAIYVSGRVLLDPALVEKADGIRTLYLILYDADSTVPMPYGAVRERLSESMREGSGYNFLITKEKIQTMRPDAQHFPPKNLRVKARLDKDGRAGRDQPGDLTGMVGQVPLGTTDVELKISQYIGPSD